MTIIMPENVEHSGFQAPPSLDLNSPIAISPTFSPNQNVSAPAIR